MNNQDLSVKKFKAILETIECSQSALALDSSSNKIVFENRINFHEQNLNFEAIYTSTVEIPSNIETLDISDDDLSLIDCNINNKYEILFKNFNVIDNNSKLSEIKIEELLTSICAFHDFINIAQLIIDAYSDKKNTYYAAIRLGGLSNNETESQIKLFSRVFLSRNEAEIWAMTQAISIADKTFAYCVFPSSVLSNEHYKLANATLNSWFNDEIAKRDNEPDFQFFGTLLASVPDSSNAERWTELCLYLTKKGTFICQEIGHTKKQGEQNRFKAETAASIEDVTKFFGYGWLAKKLYLKANINSAIQID